MNSIYIGTDRNIQLPKSEFLFIHNTLPKVRGAKIFDPTKDHINLLAKLHYRKICAITDAIGALFPEGENTLTRATGLEYIAEQLDAAMVAQVKGEPISLRDLIPEPDKKSTTGHVWAYGKIRRLLRSPVLNRMLTGKDFKFGKITLARVDPAALTLFDAQAVTFFLMTQYPQQLVISDYGLYAREMHAQLILEDRLIAGVNTLSELPPQLRQLALLQETIACGTTWDDAETLAKKDSLYGRGSVDFGDKISEAMRGAGGSV
jgi:hypothetical protein